MSWYRAKCKSNFWNDPWSMISLLEGQTTSQHMWIHVCISKGRNDREPSYLVGLQVRVGGAIRGLKGVTQIHVCSLWLIIISWHYFHNANTNFFKDREKWRKTKQKPYWRVSRSSQCGGCTWHTAVDAEVTETLPCLTVLEVGTVRVPGADWRWLETMGSEPHLGRITPVGANT